MKKLSFIGGAVLAALYVSAGFATPEPYKTELPGKLEQESYQDLTTIGIKPSIFKTRRRKQLEALGALVADTACKRIIEILGHEGEQITLTMRSQLGQLIRPYGQADYLRAAYNYAVEDFVRQIERDNKRLGGISSIVALPKERAYDLVSLELEELNERYTPIINAIINELKRPTILPYALSINALRNMQVPVNPVQ